MIKIKEQLDQSFAKTIIAIVTLARESALHGRINSFAFNSPAAIINKINQDKEYSVKANAIVNSVINKLANKQASQTYVTLAAEIFEQIANKHPYKDGNKRTALFSSILILEIFTNKDFKWITNDSNSYVNFVIGIVEKHNIIKSQTQVNQIKKFLINEMNDNEITISKEPLTSDQIIHRAIYFAKKNSLNNQFKKIMNNLKFK